MATGGAKPAPFTTDELNRFNPLYIQFVKKEKTNTEIAASLGNDRVVLGRFQQYVKFMNELRALEKQRQESESNIAQLQQQKSMLVQSTQQHQDNIRQAQSALVSTVSSVGTSAIFVPSKTANKK